MSADQLLNIGEGIDDPKVLPITIDTFAELFDLFVSQVAEKISRFC